MGSRRWYQNPALWPAIAAFLLSLVKVFDLAPIPTIVFALVPVCILAFIVFLFLPIRNRITSRDDVRVYEDVDHLPNEYRIRETLGYLQRNKATIEIIGRTCFQWLCGREEDFINAPERFEAGREELQSLMIDAVKGGSDIHFILQNEKETLSYFDASENKRLDDQGRLAIESFETARSKMDEQTRPRLRMSFVNRPVDESIVRLTEDGRVGRIVLDLNTRFKNNPGPHNQPPIPVIVITRGMDREAPLMKRIDGIVALAVPYEKVFPSGNIGEAKLRALLQKFPWHSSLRNDKVDYLLSQIARLYLRKVNHWSKKIPPLSVQLLVTNECTTQCKMCDHYRLHKGRDGKNELTEPEILSTMDCISDIGTKSVVVSGGEPLARHNILGLLEYGKAKGLSLGLLTNGICPGHRPLTGKEAERLVKSCSWIQLSIDSFRRDTYAKIRTFDVLDVASASLREICNTGFRNIEVCYTIQHDNCSEVSAIEEESKRYVPAGVPLRLKFAHGPLSSTRKNRRYLCDKQEINDIIRDIPRSTGPRVNSDYLLNMLNGKYYDVNGLRDGVPIAGKMAEYKNRRFTCKALWLTCKIDAKGDLYPCCFLFDDNRANTELRTRFRIGSLRSVGEKRVLSPSKENGNRLAELWYQNDRLQGLRKQSLPIHPEACGACTRHFYQNEFMNEAYEILKSEGNYRLPLRYADVAADPGQIIWL